MARGLGINEGTLEKMGERRPAPPRRIEPGEDDPAAQENAGLAMECAVLKRSVARWSRTRWGGSNGCPIAVQRDQHWVPYAVACRVWSAFCHLDKTGGLFYCRTVIISKHSGMPGQQWTFFLRCWEYFLSSYLESDSQS